jgi:dipeptidyl aminopeptidase/acylaminoacyl peptidase
VSAIAPSDVQISPNGEQALYVSRPFSSEVDGPASSIWLVGRDGGPARRLTASEVSDDSPRWSPDGRAIAFTSDRQKRGVAQLYLLPLSGGEAVRLTDRVTGVIAFEWSPDGSRLAFASRDSETDEVRKRRETGDDANVVDMDIKRAGLWLLDVPAEATSFEPGSLPEARRVSPENVHIGGYVDSGFAWAPDGSGFVVMAGASPRTNDRIRSEAFHLSLDGKLVSLGKLDGVIASPRYSPDGSTLAYVGVEDQIPARFVLLTMPAAGGPSKVVAPGYNGSFMEFHWLPDSRHIVAGVETGQRASFVRVNVESGAVEEAFTPAEPRGTTSGLSTSADGRRCAFPWETASSFGDVHVADLGGTSTRLTDLNPWVREYDLGELREIAWESFDGMSIEGLLILPVGYDGTIRYPLLTHIHGGPAASWSHHVYANWHDWGQFLAQRGFAVFMPNPRGSTGRDAAFLRAVVDSYGESDLQDILTGVDYLIAEGIADPDRLVVGGWSGGGYLTNRMITSTNRFKAAVSGAGTSNWISFLGTADIRDVFTHYVGDIAVDPETAWRLSPIRSVKQATTPTLILFGENDPRVPPTQGYELYAGLRSRGVETQMVLYPREGHGIGERTHQLDVLRRVIDWYDRHLGRDQST